VIPAEFDYTAPTTVEEPVRPAVGVEPPQAVDLEELGAHVAPDELTAPEAPTAPAPAPLAARGRFRLPLGKAGGGFGSSIDGILGGGPPHKGRFGGPRASRRMRPPR